MESIITCFILGSVMTIYLQNKGFTIGQIILTHAVHVSAGMAANIPTGYLADRTSRKLCNLAGDALAGIGILLFAWSDTFDQVLLVRIVIGVGMSFSLGADTTLMKAVCEHLGEDFTKQQATTTSIRTMLMVAGGIGAGIVVVHYPTLAMLLAALPYLLGAGIACFIREVKAPAEVATKSLRKALRISWSDERVRWIILAGSIAAAMSGAAQDLAVPIILQGGYSVTIASFSWSAFFAAWSIGAWLYRIAINTWRQRTLFSVPIIALIGALGILAISINKWTVIALPIMGLVFGWLDPQLSTIITNATPSELRATVLSIYTTVVQVTYILSAVVMSQITTTGVGHVITMCFAFFTLPLLFVSMKFLRTL